MNLTELDLRKRKLLMAVVREYVESAAPVGSLTLSEKYGFELSPATIRNELAALEELGLIEQPHTSAGRIPSELGFQTFVELALADHRAGVPPSLRRRLETAEIPAEPEEAVKAVAKHVAECAREAVIVAFSPRHIYYTGLSHLFNQPEFREFGRVVSFSELIDRMDEVMSGIYERVPDEVDVWIGAKNPFGAQCGTIIARCPIAATSKGAIGILGPLRMDYERGVALLSMAQGVLADAFAAS